MKYPDYHPHLFLHRKVSSVKHTEPSVCSGSVTQSSALQWEFPAFLSVRRRHLPKPLYQLGPMLHPLYVGVWRLPKSFALLLRGCFDHRPPVLAHCNSVFNHCLKDKMRSICFSCPWLPSSRVRA